MTTKLAMYRIKRNILKRFTRPAQNPNIRAEIGEIGEFRIL